MPPSIGDHQARGVGERFATGSGRAYLDLANVVQYDFNDDGTIDHGQTCAGWNSSCPTMSQHGGGYRDKPLSEIFANSTKPNVWHQAHRI